MRTLLTWIPRILAALAFMGLALLGATPWLRDRLPPSAPLVGMQLPAERPPLTLATLWSGAYQKAAEDNAAAALPPRPAIVRAFNQAQWNAFGTSYMASGTIIRGRKGALFEESYITAKCGLLVPVKLETLPRFAQRLRRVQDWFEARGQRFVYVMAPVKTTWFPELIPTSYPCRGPKADSIYPAAREALEAAGVRWVDGRAALEAQRGKLGYELFPRNGIHWNDLGVAVAADALVDELRRQGLAGPKLAWTVETAPDEVGSDRDLASLLNLAHPPRAWKTPRVTPHPLGPPGSGKLTLTAVNDSFMDTLSFYLSRTELVSRARNYGYVNLAPVEYRSDGVAAIPPEGLLNDLKTADIVVLETVETQAGGELGRRFLKIMEAEMAKEPRAKPRG